MIRVVNVRGLRRDDRKDVCYVGRASVGWPKNPWGNPFRVGDLSPNNFNVKLDREHALQLFRDFCESKEEGGTLHPWLSELWEACGHGGKPLGCWCVNATHGDGSPIVCHAQILAELLVKFYFCLDCGRKVTQASVAYFEFDDFGVPTCVKCHEKE